MGTSQACGSGGRGGGRGTWKDDFKWEHWTGQCRNLMQWKLHGIIYKKPNFMGGKIKNNMFLTMNEIQ